MELFVELYERDFIEIKDVHLAQKWIQTLQQMNYVFPTIANEIVGMVKRPRTITSSSSQPQKPVQTHVETTRTREQQKYKIIDQLPLSSVLDHNTYFSNMHSQLPFRRLGMQSLQKSTFNPEGNDGDFGYFIYENKISQIDIVESVIMEDEGAGMITRLWTAVWKKGIKIGQLQLVIDGVTTAHNFYKLCTEQNALHALPLTPGHPFVGCTIALMIPYKKYARVSLLRPKNALGIYSDITYHKYHTEPASVPKSDPAKNNELTNSIFKNAQMGMPPVSNINSWSRTLQTLAQGKMVLQTKEPNVLWHVSSIAGVVQTIRLNIDSSSRAEWNSIRLVVHWDNDPQPYISVTLADLFLWPKLIQNRSRKISAYGIGFDSHPSIKGGYIHFPMPFWNSAKISLVVEVKQNVTPRLSVDYIIEGSDSVYAKQDAAYFGIQQRVYNTVPQGQPASYAVLNRGFGKIVGTAYYAKELHDAKSMTSHKIDGTRWYEKLAARHPNKRPSSPWSFEGDARVHIDGITVEASTGSEDYYGFGHGFSSHASNVMAGSAYPLPKDITSWQVYRMRPHEHIPFNTEAIMDHDHGDGESRNYVPISANMLSFYYASGVYRKSRNLIGGFDTFEAQILGNFGPYKYSVTKSKIITLKDAQRHALNDAHNLFSMKGIQIDGDGQHSQFAIQLPLNHRLITIRRTFDFRWCNQRAIVSVNGQVVGPWFSAGCDFFAPVKVEEFSIPFKFTDKQSSITIMFLNSVESETKDMIAYGGETKKDYSMADDFVTRRSKVPYIGALKRMSARQSWTELKYEIFADY